MSSKELLARIDAAIAEKNLLKHPFYQDWQAGKLTRANLQLYAEQYYRHVEAFPLHLRTLAERADDGLRQIVLENLAEEENPARPHPRLWRDFAGAVGSSDERIAGSAPLAGTKAVVETFRAICAERPVAEAVAALYAYEAQVPEIAATKIDGLRRFYGITSEAGLAYFELHEQADKEHRAAWRNWLEANASAEQSEQILDSTNRALEALWGALDAVHTPAN